MRGKNSYAVLLRFCAIEPSSMYAGDIPATAPWSEAQSEQNFDFAVFWAQDTDQYV